MSYYIEINGQNITALYRDDVLPPPDGAILVSEDVGERLRKCSNFGAYKWQGGLLVSVALPVNPPLASTSLQFMDRFTEAEQLAIVTATMSVAAVKLWYDRMIAASEIVYKDPRTLGGLQALVAAGLITASRMDKILPEAWR